MAQRDKHLVGLDIDPSGITAAAVTINGRLNVRRAATMPLEVGVMRDGEVVDSEALTIALRAFFREHKDLGKRVRVGVANSKIVVRVIEVPPTSNARELDAAVRFLAQEHIPMALDSAVLDYVTLESVEDAAGTRERVLLVAARRDMVERLLHAVRRAGLKPVGIDLAAFALVRALSHVAPADEHVLYLCVGGLTNLAVAHGRRCVFTRVSTTGLESLAVELAERQELTVDHARGWLAHVGVERPVEAIEGDREIVADARTVLLEGARRIASDVRSSLDFHSMSGDADPISSAVLTGVAAAVPGFHAALQSELGLPVQCVAVDGTPDDIDPGRVSVAAGLAIEELPA